MCGRFYVEDDETLIERITRLNRNVRVKTGDVHPGESAAVLRMEKALRADAMKWGLGSKDGKLVINARSETASEKPMFRELWRSCRLLIPAHGYYEWDAMGGKHFLGTGGGIYLAGLYRPDENSFVVLTREAASGIKSIHPRMPVIFTKQAARAWLKRENDPVRVLNACETDSIEPKQQQMRLVL